MAGAVRPVRQAVKGFLTLSLSLAPTLRVTTTGMWDCEGHRRLKSNQLVGLPDPNIHVTLTIPRSFKQRSPSTSNRPIQGRLHQTEDNKR